ncbi:MAG: metallopeptidase family protein [Dehalococcoidia bacterium]|nr:metallopeptidase family protein [Dehalococcoidia bacterium]
MIYLSRREFIRLVRQAYRQVPPAMREAMQNLDIVVEERPRPEDLDLADAQATLFGMYTGVPLPDREGDEPLLPDRIVLYRRPILENCSSRAEAAREIRVTLLHEVGHYLGMNEEDLDRLGYG